MRTVHELDIRAPGGAVFDIGAAVERWPALDPAYRWCRILERRGARTVFEMAGNIRGWPGRWTALQELFPSDRIVFTHLRGLTTGMHVEWSLRPASNGAPLSGEEVTRLRITHDLRLRWPLIGGTVSDLIIGPIFIDWIARRTLAAVRRAAESRTDLAGERTDLTASSSRGRTGETEVTE